MYGLRGGELFIMIEALREARRNAFNKERVDCLLDLFYKKPYCFLGIVIIGKLSVLNGEAGSPSLLNRFPSG